MGTTRKLIERVPDDRLSWKPHLKSMSLAGLATHVAHIPAWGRHILNEPFFDLSAGPPHIAGKGSRSETLAVFDESRTQTRTALDRTDAELIAPWVLRRGAHVMFSMPRASAFRTFVLYHLVH